ncbi:MAG: alpha-2-macroglobulin family protein [Deltaproteobacteria bacterium]|nr:alpha-2-macroglobulin family protein [Deltaproteobacteria bacterium]
MNFIKTKMIQFFKQILRCLLWVKRQLVGDFQWQAPYWILFLKKKIISLGAWAIKRPLKTGISVLLIAGAGFGSYYGYRYWKSRPQPHRVDFSLSQIGRTYYATDDASLRKPKPLTLVFQESVAPLDQVGKEIQQGIQIYPQLEGQWTWENDRRIKFQPQNDWPIGQEYQVKIKPELLKPHVLLEKYQEKFTTPEFFVKLDDAKFYQDPIEADVKKVVVNLSFSHPIDPQKLEDNIELRLEEQSKGIWGFGKETTPFKVSYDKYKLHAYIHSEKLALPKNPGIIHFRLASGITAARGGNASEKELKQSISIPGRYSLDIKNLDLQVVTNPQDQAEQVMMFETSFQIQSQELEKHLSVWALPRKNPFRSRNSQEENPEAEKAEENSDQELFDDWSSEEVTDEILARARKVALETIPTENEYSSLQSFKYKADVGTRLYVKVEKGLKAWGDYELGNPNVNLLRVPEYPPELKILSRGALLSLSGEKKIAFMTRDLKAVKIEIGRVLPGQLHHLVSQSSGDYANPEFYDRIQAENLSERIEHNLILPSLEPGKVHYEALNLGDYLQSKTTGEKRGVFLVTLKNYDPKAAAKKEKCLEKFKRQLGESPSEAQRDAWTCDESEEEYEDDDYEENVRDRRLILVTDLGILAKESLDGTQDIFIQSIHSGEPVSGATVKVMGKNGIALFSKVTDDQGHASFPKVKGLSKEQSPTVIIAEKNGDLSFLPYNKHQRRLDMSRFEIGGVHNSEVPDQVSAYLFSDRGIYRPGDTFNIGMIVKPADWKSSLIGLPLEVEVLDSRGLSIRREKIKLPASGFMELSHQTEESAPTGNYRINLYLVKDKRENSQIASTQIKVKEFLPDRMKVSARFSKLPAKGWIHPKDLKAIVEAKNLFGTSAENRRVTAELTLSPSYPAFEGFSDYEFHDPYRAKKGYDVSLSDQRTNEKGEAEFDLGLQKYDRATYHLHFLARAYEAGSGRHVAAEAESMVSELDYLVGYKAEGDLNYVSKNSERKVELIAINSEAQKTEVKNLKLQRIETKYISILNKQEDGTYQYESRKKEVLMEESPLTINAKGSTLTLATNSPGNFSYVLQNTDGLELNRIFYSVAGKGNVSRNLERNAELYLNLNKGEFKPGEEIEISIRAPYYGAGLITIERDKVYAAKWFKTETTSSVQTIKVPEDFEGNGYVNVQFIRDPNSDEIFMSPLSYAVSAFKTSLAHRQNNLQLNVRQLVKPGDDLKIEIQSEKPTQVVVFAVDEGILQVAGYRMPKPLESFFKKRMLEVQTSQILDLILPEFQKLVSSSAAGGDEEGPQGKHLNPFKRKRQKPVVFWSGIVDVEDSRTFNYAIPDYFNGSLKVMAVAVNSSTVGVAQSETKVRGDFVLSPNVPLMVTPGDEFEVSVGVANNVKGSGKGAAVELQLNVSSHLELIGESTQVLKIDEMRESMATYRLKAKSGKSARLGSASLSFTAKFGDKSARLIMDTSVRPATPLHTQLSLGSFKKSQEVEIKRDLFAEHRQLEAGISPLPLILAGGLSEYLDKFEHLCSEQLISQSFPSLVLSQRPEFAKMKRHSAKQGQEKFKNILKILRTRQNAQGGFGLWYASSEADEFVSVYAVHMLMEAQEANFEIPEDMLEKSTKYLKDFAKSPSQTLWGLRNRAYAAYLLTRQEEITTPILTSIRESLEKLYPKEWKQDLTAAYLATSYQLLKEEDLASDLIEGSEEKLRSAIDYEKFSYDNYYDPLIRNAQTLYLLSRHFPSIAKALPEETLENLVESISKGHYNTLSSAYLILALDAYAKQMENNASFKLGIAEIDKQGQAKALDLPENSLMPQVKFSPNAVKLRMSNSGSLKTYYAVSETGFDKIPPQEELREGIEIFREFLNEKGEPSLSFQVGDEIQVRLRFRSTNGKYVSQIALVDLLPGGFEPVIDTASATMAAKKPSGSNGNYDLSGLVGAYANQFIEFLDAREDRILFYTNAQEDLGEIHYKIRATNAGKFVVPPAYGESMYERNIQARSVGGQVLEIKKP